MNISGTTIIYSIPIQYKTNDPVKGEEFQPLFIIPKVELKSDPEVALSINNAPVKIEVSAVENGGAKSGFNIKTNLVNVVETSKGSDQLYHIKNTEKSSAETIQWSAIAGSNVYDSYKKLIQYDHIPNVIYFPKAESRLVAVDLKTAGKRVGYIPGAGDKIPEALQKMGYEVTSLSQKDITAANLKQFDAIVTGVRAYNIYEWLNNCL